MSRDPSDNSGILPPWLRGVPLPPRPADASEPPAPFAPLAAAPAAPEPGAEPLPEWLRDMSAENSDAGTTLPPWLQEDVPQAPSTPPAPAASAGGTREAEPLPAWLTNDDAQRPQEPGTEALPDWLRDLAADNDAGRRATTAEPAAAETAAVPDWFGEMSSSTAFAPEAHDEDIPDWLHGIAEHAPPAAAEEPLPDWLREDDNAAPPQAPAMERASEPAAPPAAEPVAPDSPAPLSDTTADRRDDETGVPEWLRNAENEASTETASEPVDVTPFSLADLGIGDSATNSAAPPNDEPAATPNWFSQLGGDVDDVAPTWLASETPAESTVAREEPAAPAWLRDLDAPAEPAQPPAEASPLPGTTDDVPGWLLAATPLDTLPPQPAPPAPAAGPVDEGQELPDWLRPTAPEPPADALPSWLQAPSSEAAPPAQPPPDDLPDWLRPAANEAPPAAGAPGDTLPDWLGSASETPSAAEPPADALPDWLRPDAEAPAVPEVPELPQAPAIEAAGATKPEEADAALPSWLRASDERDAGGVGDAVPPWLRDEIGQPLPSASAAGEAGLPEWLRGASTDPQPAEREQPGAPSPPSDAAPSSFDWFDEKPTTPAADNDLLGGAELPAWLKAETEPKQETSTVDTHSVDWLTRLGVQDEEVVATAVQSPRLAPPRAPMRSAAQVEAAALLRQLAAAPYPDAEAAPPALQPSIWRRLGLERALYLLLLVALLGGLLLPNLTAPLQGTPEVPGAPAIHERIDALTEQDVVLVGYEWDARRISELRPLEQAVLDHLIARNVKLVLVSTDPQGTMLLFDLRDKLTAAQYRQNGEGYLLLGYKPGGELALRTMAQNFQSTLRSDFIGNDASVSALATGLDTGTPLASVRDFAMTIVLADDAGDVQAWMEQIRPVTAARQDAPGQPMLFLLPAEAAPIVQPYMAQDDVLSLAGYQGALAYQALRGTADESLSLAAAQLRFATLAFVALLLAGGVVAVVSRVFARRRAQP